MSELNDERRQRRPRSQSKEETRRELLATAHEILLEEGLPVGINMKLTDVLARKGLTTGAAYHIWGSQRDFQEDLTVYIAEEFGFAGASATFDNAEGDEADAVIDESAMDIPEPPPGDDHRSTIRQRAHTYLERFRRRREFYIALQLWGIKSPSRQVSAAVQNGYATVHDEFVQMFRARFEEEGRRIREPYTLDDAMVAVTALTEGFTLRQRFDQSKLVSDNGDYLYAEALIALMEYFTEPVSAGE